MITVLSGGTGGAKFIQGLARAVPPEALTIIVNTGDDFSWWGLRISPDLDSVTYALAGMLSRERGWGIEGETFACLGAAGRLGLPTWFQLGDRDLALHMARTELLRGGKSLAQATAEISSRLEVSATILPMTNDIVETRILTALGELSFQEYFVRERYRPEPLKVRVAGIESAAPAPGVLQAIFEADAVVIAPSNPVTSIGPILGVSGIREALRTTKAPIAAISPIVCGSAVSGPAASLMQATGLESTSRGVVTGYSDFLDLLVADSRDRDCANLGRIRTHFCDTIMTSDHAKEGLAREVLGALENLYPREITA